jgi:hypothetical protein
MSRFFCAIMDVMHATMFFGAKYALNGLQPYK